MSSHPTSTERARSRDAATAGDARTESLRQPDYADGEMACPVCFAPMPDLKGGKATICPNCGFKDSCCF